MPVPNEIIQEFLVETHDSLGRLEVELVLLEKGEAKSETLSSVFRAIHSLKGSAGFLGFQKLESLTQRRGEPAESPARPQVDSHR